jgi:hypothetical protein
MQKLFLFLKQIGLDESVQSLSVVHGVLSAGAETIRLQLEAEPWVKPLQIKYCEGNRKTLKV